RAARGRTSSGRTRRTPDAPSAACAGHRSATCSGDDKPDGAEYPRDFAAVLHHRVTSWHERTSPAPGHRVDPLIGGLITPAGQLDADVPADQRAAIEQLEVLMSSRVGAVTRRLLQNPPSWLRALGAPPADSRHRNTWLMAVETITAH